MAICQPKAGRQAAARPARTGDGPSGVIGEVGRHGGTRFGGEAGPGARGAAARDRGRSDRADRGAGGEGDSGGAGCGERQEGGAGEEFWGAGPIVSAVRGARQRNRRIHATAVVGVGRIDFPCFRWNRARGGTRHGCATRGGRRRGRRGWRDSRQRGDHRRSGAGSYGFSAAMRRVNLVGCSDFDSSPWSSRRGWHPVSSV